MGWAQDGLSMGWAEDGWAGLKDWLGWRMGWRMGWAGLRMSWAE